MIIEKLRASTAGIHKELDLWLMPVFKNINTLDSYADLLKAFYGYYTPVLKKISGEMNTRYLPDFTQRRNTDSILHDLRAIQKDNTYLPLAVKLPSIQSLSDAFGALYVLEGSTLGGIFLSRVLAGNIGIKSSDAGLSFFYGYGERSREMWDTFIEQINNFATEQGNEQAIINAAVSTFSNLKDHLQQSLPRN